MNAVNSEFKQYLNNDGWRINQATKLLFNQKHPLAKFNVGTIDTLNVTDIRSHLLDFYNTHYSSERMRLVVRGKESVEQLEQTVVSMFKDVKRRNTIHSAPDSKPFGDRVQLKLMKIKSLSPKNELSFVFQLPNVQKHSRFAALAVIDRLIESRSSGSLYSHLRQKGFVTSVSSGADARSTFTIFEVSIQLTDSGLGQVDSVIKDTVRYFEWLRNNQVPEWIFSDLQKIETIKFRFEEKTESYEVASNMVKRLFTAEPQKLISAGYSMENIEESLTDELKAYLRPDNMFIVLATDNLSSAALMKEKWYGTEYSIQTYTLPLTNPSVNFIFPPRNEYIPADFRIFGQKSENPKEAPEKQVSKRNIPVWAKQDDTFMIPKSFVTISLLYRWNSTSEIRRNIILSLFIVILKEDMKERNYNPSMAGLSFDAQPSLEGIDLKFRGYSDTLSAYIDDVAVFLSDYAPKKDVFETELEALKNFRQSLKHKSSLSEASRELTVAILNSGFSNDEYLNELESVTFAEIMEFSKEVFRFPNDAEALVTGNIVTSAASALVDSFTSNFAPNFSRSLEVPRTIKSAILNPKENSLLQIAVIDKNYAFIKYIEIGYLSNPVDLAIQEIVSSACSNLAFQVLRTEQSIGYSVGLTEFNGPVIGINIYAQSPHMPPTEIEKRVESFIAKQMATQLLEMSQEAFELYKSTIIKGFEEKDKTLMEENTRFWSKVSKRTYSFTYWKNVVDTLKRLELSDFKLMVKKKFYDERKSLSIHSWPDAVPKYEDGGNRLIFEDYKKFRREHAMVGYS